MIFNLAENTKKQGDIGEARAIYEYTRLGWVVCKPLCDSAKYDLIVENDGVIKRIQVKTTSFQRNGKYEVDIATKGGNKTCSTVKPRGDTDYDELFVLTSSNECWMIPSDKIGRKCVQVSSTKFDDYKV